MPFHQLKLEKDQSGAWSIRWDEALFDINEGDELFAQARTPMVHRIVDVYELYTEDKISLQMPGGTLTFKPEKSAAADLKALVESGLRTDPDYRQSLYRVSKRNVLVGIAAFVICGGLFALYCWWASWAPDPPRGHWIHMAGPLIHFGLLILMGLALAGLSVSYFGLRMWRTTRRIERAGFEEYGSDPLA